MVRSITTTRLFNLVLGIVTVFCFYQFGRSTRAKQERFETSNSFSNLSYPNGTRHFSIGAVSYLNSFRLDLPSGQIDDKKITFVTATSGNHFRLSLKMIRQFHVVYPDEMLIVYNLGLARMAQWTLAKEFSFVRLIPFPFAKYPTFVGNLFEYRWKPLIIAEVLMNHTRVLWMDAAIHLSAPVPLDQFDGVRLFIDPRHSIFVATNPLMYDYFPTVDPRKLQQTAMFGAGFGAFLSDPTVKISLLRWWILCALDRHCMAPKDSQIRCQKHFLTDRHTYADCHRYDQSALNLILAHNYDFNTSKYFGNFHSYTNDHSHN